MLWYVLLNEFTEHFPHFSLTQLFSHKSSKDLSTMTFKKMRICLLQPTSE